MAHEARSVCVNVLNRSRAHVVNSLYKHETLLLLCSRGSAAHSGGVK